MKANWAREANIWTPRHASTVIHGDGDTIDGFADIVIVNYEVLDRHVGWLGDLGFRGMVSTRRTSSRTSRRSARSTSCSSPSGSAPAPRDPC